MAMIDCRIKGLYFPLIVLVDYRGYRLIADTLTTFLSPLLTYLREHSLFCRWDLAR